MVTTPTHLIQGRILKYRIRLQALKSVTSSYVIRRSIGSLERRIAYYESLIGE